MADDSQTGLGVISVQTDLIKPPHKKKTALRYPMMWLQMLGFLLGVCLLAFVVYKTGFRTLTETISKVGWGFLLIVALNGTRHILRAFCMYWAVPAKHRNFKFRYALAARLGGEAVSVITFTGPFLGEATKAALLKKNLPLSYGGAAVVIDNILYYASVILLILSGVGIMSLMFSNGYSMKTALEIIAALSLLSFIGLILLVRFRVKPVGFTIRRLNKFNVAPNFLLNRLPAINELETNVYDFYTNHRSTFFSLIIINFVSHALSVAEVYAALHLLGFEANLTVSFIIESLTKVINFAFSFVPGAVGVYEGGNAVILHALGYTSATGVALALVRRGAILFWTLIGLGVLLWKTAKHGAEKFRKES